MKETLEEAAREYMNIPPVKAAIKCGNIEDLETHIKVSFKAGAEWQAKQVLWIKAKDQLPFVDEDDISEQSEPVLVITSVKGHYEPEILVYNKHYHVWDTADADDYYCDVSDNDLWMPIPKFNS